ncbi:MAG: helix-turn-helix domain-containing protein [Bacteroidota bacterium]
MSSIVVVEESELRKLVKESIIEVLHSPPNKSPDNGINQAEEPLLSRQQMASELNISLVTLTDWMKKGLPYFRMNGRVYFRRSEVIASMRHNVLK